MMSKSSKGMIRKLVCTGERRAVLGEACKEVVSFVQEHIANRTYFEYDVLVETGRWLSFQFSSWSIVSTYASMPIHGGVGMIFLAYQAFCCSFRTIANQRLCLFFRLPFAAKPKEKERKNLTKSKYCKSPQHENGNMHPVSFIVFRCHVAFSTSMSASCHSCILKLQRAKLTTPAQPQPQLQPGPRL